MSLLSVSVLARLFSVSFALLIVAPWGGESTASTRTASGAGGVRVAAAQESLSPAWSIGGAGEDEARHVAVDPSGNVYVAGVFAGDIDVDPGPDTTLLTAAGGQDLFVAKYGPGGSLRRAWSIGGAGRDDVRQLVAGGDGSVYVAGSVTGDVDFAPGDATALVQAGAGRQGFVARYDAEGALAWVSPLDLPGDEEVVALALDRTGNLLAAGWSSVAPAAAVGAAAPAGGLMERGDLFLLRLDPTGRLAWSAVLPTGSEGVTPIGLAIGPSGEIVVVASFTGTLRVALGEGVVEHASAGGADVLVLKLAPSGSLEWSRAAGGPDHDAPGAGGVAIDSAGNVLVAGVFDGPFDATGDGQTVLEGAGAGDAFVLSLTPAGDHRWAARLGGVGADGVQHVAVDAAGYVYVAGWFSGHLAMEPAAVASVLHGRGQGGATDALLAKLTPDGTLAWVRSVGGDGRGPDQSSAATALAVDVGGTVLVGGRFAGPGVDADPGVGETTVRGNGGTDLFLIWLGPDGALHQP